MPKRPYQLAIVLPDLHLPREDKRAVAAIEAYMAEEHFDWWIQLGDLLDNDAISVFNQGKPRRVVTAPTVLEQFDYANAWLDRHLGILRKNSPDCKCVITQGNHDERTERYVDRLPELAGLVDVERGLRLKERSVQWVKSWSEGELYRVGKAYFGHGVYTTLYHAARHARDFMVPIYYAHAHDVQAFSIRRRSDRQVIEAKSLGCLCDFDMDYMRGRPHNWSLAFGVFFFLPGGSFREFTVRIFDGKFIAPSNGKLYGG